jgi:hypothetical protein
LHGKFVKSMSLAGAELNHGYIMGFLKPDILVLGRSMRGKIGAEINLVKMGDSLSVIKKVINDQTGDLPMSPGSATGLGGRTYNNQIMMGSSYVYNLYFYNRRGELDRVVSRDLDDLVRPGFAGRSRSSWSSISSPVQFGNGHFLAKAAWPSNIGDPDRYVAMDRAERPKLKFKNSLDLFNPDGILLYSIVQYDSYTPDIGFVRLGDMNGRIYTTKYEPYPQICRYRVIIDE